MENTRQIYDRLRQEFRDEQRKMKSSDNRIGTQLYTFQVDFCYALDKISRGCSAEIHEGIDNISTILQSMRDINEAS